MAREIKNNSFKIPLKISRVILNHEYTYPYGYHFLLAIFPLRLRLWVERSSGALFDTGIVLSSYLFANWLISHYKLNTPSYSSLIIALLIAVYPAYLMVASGPRAYNGSPRVLGEFLYIVHILSFYVFFVTNNHYLLALSIIASSLIFISSKFAVQVLIFFSILFASFLSYDYLLIVIAGFIFSLIISGGKSLSILKGHIKHSIFYVKYTSLAPFKFKSTLFKDLLVYFSRFKKNFVLFLKGKPRLFIDWLGSERYFLHFIIIAYPQIVFTVILLVIYELPFYNNEFLNIWLLNGVLFFVLTSFPIFKFLGEGERYVEYTLPSIIIMFVLFAYHNNLELLIYCFFFYSILIYFLHFNIFSKRFGKLSYAWYEDQILFNKINLLPPGNILPINYEWQLLYRSNFPILTYGANQDEQKVSLSEFQSIFTNAHMPSSNLEQIIARFDIKYLFTSQTFLNIYLTEVYKNQNKFYQIFKPLYSNNNFTLFSLNK